MTEPLYFALSLDVAEQKVMFLSLDPNREKCYNEALVQDKENRIRCEREAAIGLPTLFR